MSSSHRHATLRHIPALDGLRGLALLGVLFFHAGGALRGGYLGVDLFFVLSGFLITSLLIAEHERTGRIALKPFWIRRARRLFPALLSLMPAIAIYARYFAKPIELPGMRGDALATLAYVANWRSIFTNKSYWELFAAPSPLEHTWSLSIEEQFYIVWPLVVAVVLRRFRKRHLLGLALFLIAASIAAMLVFFDPARTSRAYLGTDTRATSILAGAVLAMFVSPNTVFRDSTVRLLDIFGVLSAIGIGVAWWRLEGSSRFLYHGGFWLTELAALILILCALCGSRSLVARALSYGPLQKLGTISYGVYLWHWPIHVFLTPERIHVRGFGLYVIQFAATFAVSLVSYQFFERPIRLRGIPFGRAIYTVPAAIALAIFFVVRGTHAREIQGQPLTLSSPLSETAEAGRSTFRVMMLGDSTANSLGWGLRGLQQPSLTVELAGQDGCTMLADTCGPWAEHYARVRPHAVLVFLGGAFLHGTSVDGDWKKSCHPVWDGKFTQNLTRRFGELANEKGRVWAVTIPYPLDVYDTPEFRAEVDCINSSIRASAAAVPGVEILDFANQLCPSGVCQREFEGQAIRVDGVHYSVGGAAALARWVIREIQR